MDSRHVRMSPREDIFVPLKHTSEQFQFIWREKEASIGDLISVM